MNATKEKAIITATPEIISNATYPEPTRTWQPIRHDVFRNMLMEELDRARISVTGEAIQITQDATRMFGQLSLSLMGNGVDSDYTIQLGYRNSVDKMFPVGLTIGASVLVCANLCFSGDIVYSRKHTAKLMNDLGVGVSRMVGQIESGAHSQENFFNMLKDNSVSIHDRNAFLVDSVESGVIPASTMPKVLEAYESPSDNGRGEHVASQPYGSAWGFYNAFTFVMSQRMARNPFSGSKELVALTDLFKGHYQN